LFNLIESKINYLGLHFRINHIFINEAHRLIFVQYEDKSVLVFNLESPEPIKIISLIPSGCVKIWSNSSIVIHGKIPHGAVSVFGSDIVFNVYDFSKGTESIVRSESLTKEAAELFEILGYKQREGEVKKKLVLIGAKKVPTFFYAPFTIDESNVGEVSPFIIAIFELACLMITHITDIPRKNLKYDYVDSLPYLAQMVFESHPEISNIAALLLLNVIPNVNTHDYVRMISYLAKPDGDPLKFENHEQLLLAIAATFNNQLIPPSFQRPLFKILQKFSWEESSAKHVAFSLMTDGIKTWCKGNSPVEYYEFLIKALADDSANIYTMMVVHCANLDFSSFLKAFKKVYSRQILNGQNNPQMISLITNASLNCREEGTYGTLLMVELMTDFNIPLMEQHLEMHRSFFKSLDIKDETIAIGTYNGKLSVFTKKKFNFDVYLFSRPISHVKIINDLIVACSIYERKYAVLSITKKVGIFKNEKSRIIEKNKIDGDGTEVCISTNEEGKIEVVLK
jgi:hypothetical protein